LSDLVAIVTGSSSGIGRAVVEQLTAEGTTVVGFDLHDSKPHPSRTMFVDVSDEATVLAGVDRILEEVGRIDIVINSAGIGAVGSVETNGDDEWNRLWDVNVLGIVRLARATLPSLRRIQRDEGSSGGADARDGGGPRQ
jgi:NAD(P)-dependent dehydrogenase (short-subunit alcohol dehydrogenase family)